jgi:hypothetical protein
MIKRYKLVASACAVLIFYPTFVACAADKKPSVEKTQASMAMITNTLRSNH